MKELLARGTFEPNYLPEHLREGYHFCAPKRLPVKCEITTSGRLPFILISPVDRRYSSKMAEGQSARWRPRVLDPAGLRRLAHGHHLQRRHGLRRYLAVRRGLGPCPSTIAFNRSSADASTPLASRPKPRRYRSIRCCSSWPTMPRPTGPSGRILLFHELPEAHGDAGGVGCSADRIRQRRGALVYNDGYVPPTPVRAPATSDPSTGPAMPAPARAHVAPRLPGRRFNVPRGMR